MKNQLLCRYCLFCWWYLAEQSQTDSNSFTHRTMSAWSLFKTDSSPSSIIFSHRDPLNSLGSALCNHHLEGLILFPFNFSWQIPCLANALLSNCLSFRATPVLIPTKLSPRNSKPIINGLFARETRKGKLYFVSKLLTPPLIITSQPSGR